MSCLVCHKENASIVGNCYNCGHSTCASCVSHEDDYGNPICIKCTGIYDFIIEIKELKEKVKELEEENKNLKLNLEFKYSPEGSGAQEAKDHFRSLTRKTKNLLNQQS